MSVYRKHRFTLIELLMVIGVMIILASIGVAGMSMAMRRANEADTRSRMEQLKTALENHYSDWGYYPVQDAANEPFDISEFETLGDNSGPFRDRNDRPYLGEDQLDNDLVLDGFGEPFRYRSPGEHNRQSYDLWSYGSDRENGTETDITNWRR